MVIEERHHFALNVEVAGEFALEFYAVSLCHRSAISFRTLQKYKLFRNPTLNLQNGLFHKYI